MNVFIDRASGEILDLLWSLFYMANYDYVMNEVKKTGIQPDEEIEKIQQSLMNNKKLNRKKIDFLFNEETKISDALIGMSEVFGKTIEQCLSKVETMGREEIILRLVKELKDNKFNNKEQLIKDAEAILKDNKLIEFIKNLEISNGAKWNLVCFIENAEGYAIEAAQLIREFEPVYSNEIRKQKNSIDKFHISLEKRIAEDKEHFFNVLLKGSFRKEAYDEIRIIPAYLHYHSLYFFERGRSATVILGKNYEKYMNELQGSSLVERNLIVFKNLSDRTRFEIIKLLLKRDYFGQELAELLNITTATVSYHMNYLFAAGLVEILRKDHKAFYTLNKDTIRSCIEFLKTELEL